jgi:Uma2 family endonuclease
MTLLEQLVRSPRLPQMVQEMKDVLAAERPRRRKFFQELREDQKAEFINGEVVVHSPVQLVHDRSSFLLAKLIGTYVDLHSLGYVSHEKLLVCLTRNDYEPDISYFNSAKAAAFKPQQMRFPAPDLVAEVLSPSTERNDRTIKFEDYAGHGVSEYWIVDPRKRTVEQYLLSGDQYEPGFKGRAGKIRSRAIRGMEISVRAIFDAKENLRAIAEILRG